MEFLTYDHYGKSPSQPKKSTGPTQAKKTTSTTTTSSRSKSMNPTTSIK